MERIVWRGRLRPWNLVIYRIGNTMYRDPALNSARTLPHFRAKGCHPTVFVGDKATYLMQGSKSVQFQETVRRTVYGLGLLILIHA